jgi:predicted nucleotidyltransferase
MGYMEEETQKYQQFVDEFNELFPDRKLLFLVKAGSHFFDLNSPNSDTDYRGIYMPSKQEFYEGEGRRRFWERKTTPGNRTGVRNSKDDVDFYLFSYTFFLELLGRGDFNCLELLHAPQDKIIIDSPEMQYLTSIRKNLIVNDISAFLGFIKKEYKRYGVNIHHYEAQQNFYDFLIKFNPHTRLKDIWGEIKEYAKNDNQIVFTESFTGKKEMVPTLKLAQRLYQNTVRVDYVTKALKQRFDTYGHRQKSMAVSGKEFKGLYHALRLIYEANDIFDYGEMQLPFSPERHQMLRNIKDGNIEQEELFNLIDSEIDRLYNREKETTSNKERVQYTINKIINQKIGEQKIKYLRGITCINQTLKD